MHAPTAPYAPPGRATLIYNDATPIPVEYRSANSLVLLGSGGHSAPAGICSNAGQQECVEAGGLPGYYFDVIVRNTVGFIREALFNASQFGAAIPSAGHGTSWGPAADLRVAHAVDKCAAVFEYILDNNPHMRWVMLDDGGPNWQGYWTMTAAMREDFYQALVAIFTRLRQIADQRGIYLMVNGVWDGRGATESPGGALLGFGYHPDDPDGSGGTSTESRRRHGTTLVHWTMLENINLGDFWDAYMGVDILGSPAKPGRWGLPDPNGNFAAFVLQRSDQTGNLATLRAKPWCAWLTQWVGSYGEPMMPPTQPARDIGLAEPPPEETMPLPPTSITANPDGTFSVALPADVNRGIVAGNFRTNPHGSEQHPGWGAGAPYGADVSTLQDPWFFVTDDGTAKTLVMDPRVAYGAANNPPIEGNPYHYRCWVFTPDMTPLPFPPVSITGDARIAYSASVPFTMPAPPPSGPTYAQIRAEVETARTGIHADVNARIDALLGTIPTQGP